ncbi:MAG: HNH endonuclease [Bacteroidetes bacterium]|nr:HNH endonuclease [Bacteroidota bacterium]MBU1718181.1 HNH endonuclease [Bacteroidota bacterium]
MEKRKLRKIDDEEWKIIPFTETHYELSNYGRVRSFTGQKEGKIIKTATIQGFPVVSLRVDGTRKNFYVHKIVAELYIPKENEKQCVVIHLDWNKKNNFVKNLQWVSTKESYERLSVRMKQLRADKPRKTNTKLKIEDVHHIRQMLEKGIKQKLIAQMFCISEMQVSRIKKGTNWGDV